MVNQSWLMVVSAGFFIIVLIFLAAIAFLIYTALELRKIGANLKEFLKITEESLIPVLKETELTLQSIRKISDNIGKVTEDAKKLTSAVNDVAINITALSLLFKDLREGVLIRTSGIKAGIREAFNTFLKQLRERR
ncbi:MAG: DUF948 domain-containing protein [Thermodesulfovibrionales bacterium]|nr:DUF948 domain-containing protein [Thermodesulfovibrionales bacterium]